MISCEQARHEIIGIVRAGENVTWPGTKKTIKGERAERAETFWLFASSAGSAFDVVTRPTRNILKISVCGTSAGAMPKILACLS
jgi:hypothetical protein